MQAGEVSKDCTCVASLPQEQVLSVKRLNLLGFHCRLCEQVKTLEGNTVWRRRHYRVRRAELPGTFFFSVLDNGVISKEFWRIVYAAEDLSWALFYYAGAASVVGQAYRGAHPFWQCSAHFLASL